MNLQASDLNEMERFYRANLINSVTGYKSLHLVGTQNKEGISNLAVFSQVIHLGADPALIGILFRPRIPGMNTLENIQQTGYFTLNHILPEISQQAHWTSAKWSSSEFGEVGLTEEYKYGFPAPFVKESVVKIGLRLVGEYPVSVNNTCLIAGAVEYLEFPDEAIKKDGFVDLLQTRTVAGFGLDGYFDGERYDRYSYAKPGMMPEII
ncbi:MAG TPA: flavin reductase [Catalimonadaceae bacterium]|nr:flavin reductase [Catalimonadaceae bacterium]